MPANEHYRGYPLPAVLTGHALRTVCFQIPDNDEYKRAFWDRVFQLTQHSVWQKDNYADTRNQIAGEYWEQLLYSNLTRFIDDPDCGVPQPNTCQTYPPTAPFIQWFPNDPVYTPDLVGEGYNSPAWYFATLASNLAYGSRYGDVITSLDRFPPGSLPDILPASGLPRFRINVNGTGVVKAKLVNMFGGSLIQTTVDDDIGTLNFVDVAKDEIAAPPETNGELIVEFELTTPGAHHIDFIVISWVNSSVPFLHHGGGLRQVELCGFDEMPIYSPPFRFTEACGLEFYDGEAWQPVTGWTDFAPDCFTGPAGADGADGATLFIRDTGDGQLETSPDNAIWTDVTNAQYVHLNGDIPMTGGLEILGVADEAKLTLRGVGAPFQTSVLASFRDANNVERAWINPRGQASFSTGGAPGNPALTLVQGGILIDNNEKIIFKSLTGAQENHWFTDVNNTMRVQANNGWQYTNVAGNILMSFVAGLYTFQNGVAGGRTIFTVREGAGQSTNPFIQFQQSDGTDLFKIQADGRIETYTRDGNVNSSPNNLILDHETSSTPLANFGAAMRFRGKSDTVASRDLALLVAAWETVADATRKSYVKLSAFDTAEREILKGRANGTLPEIGFLSQTPQPRITVTGDRFGNEATANLLTAIEGFGLIVDSTTDTGLPEPGTISQFTRSQIASRAAVWMLDFYEFNIRAFLDVLPLFGDPEAFIYATTLSYMPNVLDLIDWVEAAGSEYNPGTETELNDHIDTVRADIQVIREALYCALTVDGCADSSFKAVFINLLDAINIDMQRFVDFCDAFSLSGLGMMISNALLANCEQDVDLTETNCDNWSVFMGFQSDPWLNAVELNYGSYSSTNGYVSLNGTNLSITIDAHVLFIAFEICVNVENGAPNSISVINRDNSNLIDITPSLNCHVYELDINSASGVDINIAAPAGEGNAAYLHYVIAHGIGTEPTP